MNNLKLKLMKII